MPPAATSGAASVTAGSGKPGQPKRDRLLDRLPKSLQDGYVLMRSRGLPISGVRCWLPSPIYL